MLVVVFFFSFQARAKALALEEELKTARELIEENGGLYDVRAFVHITYLPT